MKKLLICLFFVLLFVTNAIAEPGMNPYEYAMGQGYTVERLDDSPGHRTCFLTGDSFGWSLCFTDLKDAWCIDISPKYPANFDINEFGRLFVDLVSNYEWDVSFYWPDQDASKISLSYNIIQDIDQTENNFLEKDQYIKALCDVFEIEYTKELADTALISMVDDLEEFFESATPADLLALRNKVDNAIKNSKEWESVNVPVGIYTAGVDIPEGKWAVRAGNENAICEMMIGNALKSNGKEVDYWDSDKWHSFELANKKIYSNLEYLQDSVEIVEIQAGYYVEISRGSVIFEPYYGLPNFSFFSDELPETTQMLDCSIEGMGLTELAALKDRLNFEIWCSYEWDRILVPAGIYKVGPNIPIGHWKVEAPEGYFVDVSYGNELNKIQMNMKLSSSAWVQSLVHPDCAFYDDDDVTDTDIDSKEGYYICLNDGVYGWFSRYIDNSKLGFKAFGGKAAEELDHSGQASDYRLFEITSP